LVDCVHYYKISSQDEQLLHPADAVIHPVFMERREWVSTYDSMPDQALAAKKRLLDRAAAEEILVFGAHFPFPGLGYVRQRKNGWKWMPRLLPWRIEPDRQECIVPELIHLCYNCGG
jgi:glyoxylase-like metal-dependent hydrolase (beta-lactamase superfamily II)